MQPTEEAAAALARRLRSLRLEALGTKVTQFELAEALGRSEALISSWERRTDPVTPPGEQLMRYAAFFCTPRSIAQRPYRVLSGAKLDQSEIAVRDKLRDELLAARRAAIAPSDAGAIGTPPVHEPWHFSDDDDRPVVVICPELPEIMQGPDPDYSELSRLADLDSLFELYGHVRAVNPDVRVEYRGVSKMRRDDSTGHLVVLGGVDWNPAQRDFMSRSSAPVEQISEGDKPESGYFQVTGDEPEAYRPVILEASDQSVLVEDVGYFFRGPNPFNRQRTVTLCNAISSRGLLGAVRTLTDKQLRDGNAGYLSRTFGDDDSYSILFRVPIISGRVVVTPDWTSPGTVLHTWSEKTA